MHHYQRPIAVTANSIGTWKTIFGLVSMIAVVTNAGLLLFTIDVFPSARSATKVRLTREYGSTGGRVCGREYGRAYGRTGGKKGEKGGNEEGKKGGPLAPSPPLTHSTPTMQVWGFYVFQVVVFVIMYVVSIVVSDTPIDVEIQLKRRDRLVDKVIRKVMNLKRRDPTLILVA